MFKKKDIIKKLKEWSEKHGGKTPSQKVFFEETEVGIYDRMRYWPNYGALVKEAGLKPNKFDKTKYTKNQLCELFIQTIREKGKWPTRGILDVKHHGDADFPDSSTFYKKLGLTEALAKNILKFAKSEKGYTDVIDVCETLLNDYESYEDKSDEAIEGTKHGWIYLLKTTFRGKSAYKIGETNDLKRRENELNQPSNDQEIIHAIETDDPSGIEKYWHNRFKDKQLKGKNEWFILNASDIRAFKKWKRIF